MPSLSELFIKRLCKNDFHNCARYTVYKYLDENKETIDQPTFEQLNKLLVSLFPNETFRIKDVLPDRKDR